MEWVKVGAGWRLQSVKGSKIRRESTLILGKGEVTLEHAFDEPRTFRSRSELKQALKQAQVHHPYFS
jgi:hypothetical protein